MERVWERLAACTQLGNYRAKAVFTQLVWEADDEGCANATTVQLAEWTEIPQQEVEQILQALFAVGLVLPSKDARPNDLWLVGAQRYWLNKEQFGGVLAKALRRYLPKPVEE